MKTSEFINQMRHLSFKDAKKALWRLLKLQRHYCAESLTKRWDEVNGKKVLDTTYIQDTLNVNNATSPIEDEIR